MSTESLVEKLKKLQEQNNQHTEEDKLAQEKQKILSILKNEDLDHQTRLSHVGSALNSPLFEKQKNFLEILNKEKNIIEKQIEIINTLDSEIFDDNYDYKINIIEVALKNDLFSQYKKFLEDLTQKKDSFNKRKYISEFINDTNNSNREKLEFISEVENQDYIIEDKYLSEKIKKFKIDHQLIAKEIIIEELKQKIESEEIVLVPTKKDKGKEKEEDDDEENNDNQTSLASLFQTQVVSQNHQEQVREQATNKPNLQSLLAAEQIVSNAKLEVIAQNLTSPVYRQRPLAIVASTKVKKDSLDNISKITLEEFLGNVFKFFNFDADTAIGCGNNYADEETKKGTGRILDVAGIRRFSDKNGVLESVKIGLTDGFGGHRSKQQDDNIAETAKTACEKFINSEKSIDDFKENIREAAHSSIGNENCSLAAVTVKLNTNDTCKVQIGNVGDGLVAIVNAKTGKIEFQIPAKQDKSMSTNFTPQPLQDLGGKSEIEKFSNLQDIDINHDGCIVIAFSDGILDCLPHEEIIDGNYKTIKIKEKEFSDIFRDKIKGLLTPNQIVTEILNYTGIKSFENISLNAKNSALRDQIRAHMNDANQEIMLLQNSIASYRNDNCLLEQVANSNKKFSEITDQDTLKTIEYFKKTLPNDSDFNQNDNFHNFIQNVFSRIKKATKLAESKLDNFTLEVWLNNLQKSEPNFSKKFRETIVEQEDNNILAMPMISFIYQYNKYKFLKTKSGDDSTILVHKIPLHSVELVRALIENVSASQPSFVKIGNICEELTKISNNKLISAVEILRAERHLNHDDSGIFFGEIQSDISFRSYPEEQLNQVANIINIYRKTNDKTKAVDYLLGKYDDILKVSNINHPLNKINYENFGKQNDDYIRNFKNTITAIRKQFIRLKHYENKDLRNSFQKLFDHPVTKKVFNGEKIKVQEADELYEILNEIKDIPEDISFVKFEIINTICVLCFALIGAAAGAAAGFAAGTVVPVIGNAVGAGAGGLAGFGVGASIGRMTAVNFFGSPRDEARKDVVHEVENLIHRAKA